MLILVKFKKRTVEFNYSFLCNDFILGNCQGGMGVASQGAHGAHASTPFLSQIVHKVYLTI